MFRIMKKISLWKITIICSRFSFLHRFVVDFLKQKDFSESSWRIVEINVRETLSPTNPKLLTQKIFLTWIYIEKNLVFFFHFEVLEKLYYLSIFSVHMQCTFIFLLFTLLFHYWRNTRVRNSKQKYFFLILFFISSKYRNIKQNVFETGTLECIKYLG